VLQVNYTSARDAWAGAYNLFSLQSTTDLGANLDGLGPGLVIPRFFAPDNR